MIHAYDKLYLEKARTALGRMLDFAVHEVNQNLADFFDMFIASGTAARMESGDFNVLVGKSGVELAYEVLEKSGLALQRVSPQYPTNRSSEFWTGWALAYYQWDSCLSFSKIVQTVSITDINALYNPYHEMDIRHFTAKMQELEDIKNNVTNIKRLRQQCGMTQKNLADFSGVPLRTIQQYEQRQKNINKASAETLYKLSKGLLCPIDAILEK